MRTLMEGRCWQSSSSTKVVRCVIEKRRWRRGSESWEWFRRSYASSFLSLQDRPTLLISHHRLEGKLVSLTKPLVVLERKQRTNGRRGSDDVSANETAYTTEAETRNVMAEVGVNTDKASKQAEKRKQRKEDADIPSSPFRYGRARAGSDGVGMGPPVSPSRSGGAELELQDDAPDSPTMAVKSTGLLNTGETAPSRRGASPQPSMSSSPMPAPHMRGSEIDYSSPVPASKRRRTIGERTVQVTSDADGIPHDVNGELIEDGAEAGEREGIEEADWLYKRETSTYFEVVCIIRKKLLFSKRPEPVVRLDGEGAEQARAAIGRSKVA